MKNDDFAEPLWRTLMKVAGPSTKILLALPARIEEEEVTGCLLENFLARADGRFECGFMVK